jgi:hypothetical protein
MLENILYFLEYKRYWAHLITKTGRLPSNTRQAFILLTDQFKRLKLICGTTEHKNLVSYMELQQNFRVYTGNYIIRSNDPSEKKNGDK